MAKFRNQEELNTWATEVDAVLKSAKEQLAEQKAHAWAAKYRTDVKSAQDWGALTKAIVRKDTSTLASMGAMGGLAEMKSGEPITKAALGTPLTSDATTGSYVVPEQYVAEIINDAASQSELMPKVKRVPMYSRVAYVPEYLSGVDITWITGGQGSDNSEANPTFTRRTLTAYTGAFYVPVTEEFTEDSFMTFGAYLRDLATDAWVTAFDAAMLTSSSPFTGVLQDAATSVQTMTGAPGFADAKFDDLWDTVGQLSTRKARKGASWILHPTVFDCFAKIKNANGDYIYMAPGASGRPGSLLSYPIILSDEMPSISDSAVSTKFAVLGNPNFMLWGDRVALEMKYFDNTHYGVTNFEGFFRVRVRAGFDIAMPQNFAILKTSAS